MDSSRHGAWSTMQRWRRLLLAAAIALVACVFALQTTQAATPQQATTCDGQGIGTEIRPADGLLRVNMFKGSVQENLVTSIHKITLDSGGVIYGYCIDPNIARRADVASCLFGDLTDVRLVYLITKYPPDLNSMVNQAARQAAVWHFVDNYTLDLSNPTSSSDPAIDQAVADIYTALVAEVSAIDPANPPAIFQPGPLALTISPAAAGNTLPAQQASPFVVRLTKNGLPLVGYTVSVATDFGTLNQGSATTDANGEAAFVVTSTISGTANLTATADVSIPAVSKYVDKENAAKWQPYGIPTARTEAVSGRGTVTWTEPPPATGDIALTKSVSGWTQPWSFSFALDSDVKTATNDAPTIRWTGLTPGQSYTLVETSAGGTGWSAGPIACFVGSVAVPDADTTTPGYQIVVQAGVTVDCTALNTYTPPPGAITLTKSVAGWTQPWSFGFTLDSDARTVTNDAPTASWTGLTPGQSYTLVETSAGGTGWSAGPIACFVGSVAAPDADGNTPGYQIIVQSGVTIGCTALNTYTPPPPGAITLTKSVSGWTQPWSFSFTLNSDARTATNDASTVSWTGLTPGQSYTLVEVPTSVAGWTAGPIACFLGELPIADADPGTPGYQIIVQSGATVACSVLNTYVPPPPGTGSIQLTKSVAGWTQPWSFSFTLNSDVKTATNVTPTVSWTGLTPGQTYTLSEVPSGISGWTAGPISCAIGGDPVADADGTAPGFQIVVQTDVTVACAALNTYTPPPTVGRITVTKRVTSTIETSWTFFFQLNGGAFKPATNTAPTVTWENLAPNQTYTLTEAEPDPTWEQGAFVCKIGETTVGEKVTGGGIKITLTSGADVQCIKYNYQVTGTDLNPQPEPAASSWLFLPAITR